MSLFSGQTGPLGPLLSNILPHLETLVNFITNTLPKPVIVSLLFRLSVLHFASRIVRPSSSNLHTGLLIRKFLSCLPLARTAGRTMPASTTVGKAARRRASLASCSRTARRYSSPCTPTSYVRSRLLCFLPSDLAGADACLRVVLDHSSQVWWRWMNIFFTLALWALELVVSGDDDPMAEKWKVE